MNIFEIDFNNLNWMVQGGVAQNFAVAGVDNPNDQFFRAFFSHASNAGFSGTPADGADGFYAAFVQNGANLQFDSLIDSTSDGWDKPSDINVQIEASAVPEPASMALFGIAMLGLAAARRKRATQR